MADLLDLHRMADRASAEELAAMCWEMTGCQGQLLEPHYGALRLREMAVESWRNKDREAKLWQAVKIAETRMGMSAREAATAAASADIARFERALPRSTGSTGGDWFDERG